MTNPDPIVALGPLLLALAGEIERPRQAILAAETHLAAALRSAPAVAGSVQDLQNIDLALQILNDLEGALARLGAALPADLRIDARPAFSGLKLERVAARLAAALGTESSFPPDQPSVELF